MSLLKHKPAKMDRRTRGGKESGVVVLIFHVKAARGTQERLTRAVCALAFQAFC